MDIAVIGTGNMGQALVRGFIRNGIHKPDEIKLFDSLTGKAEEFAAETGTVFCRDLEEALTGSQTVLMAVKPQVMEAASAEVSRFIEEGTIVISIAAGKTITRIRQYLGGIRRPLCRVMPNTPALIGQGISALCFSDMNEEQQAYCIELFEACGMAVKVSEDMMDAVTAVSGSGPAYAMIFIEEMAKAGIELGLEWDKALTLAAMTVKGAASLIIESGEAPDVLTRRVCSPGGTTLAAVDSFESDGFRDIIRKAVHAAARRSKELAE